MSKPFRIFLLGTAALLIAVLADHALGRRQTSPAPTVAVVAAPDGSNAITGKVSDGPKAATGVFRLRPDEVLAMVNGHAIKLADVVPVVTNGSQGDMEISVQDMKFLLKRAVDRELIFQTAKEQGLSLNEAQIEQLEKFKSVRDLPEPGGIAKLNSTGAQRELELEDAQAFMLQTSLMAAQGASPNVTETQVEAYYMDHQYEYGDLPVDEAARSQAWAKIAYAIRQRLAGATRASYNDKLVAYMNEMEASANIVVTELPLAGAD